MLPAPIGPPLLVLIAPMSLPPAVETGIALHQWRTMLVPTKVIRLFGIEIVNAIAIDMLLPTRPVFRMQGSAIVFES